MYTTSYTPVFVVTLILQNTYLFLAIGCRRHLGSLELVCLSFMTQFKLGIDTVKTNILTKFNQNRVANLAFRV